MWVTSRRGKVLARAAVDERINDGAVYMTYQWWIGKCNELTLHATDGASGTPEDKYSACQVEAIPDQAWAETYLVERYAELKAQLAAEADRQNPQPETEISAASSEVADVVPPFRAERPKAAKAAGVERIPRGVSRRSFGGSRRPIGCRRRAAPRVRAARGRGGGPRAVRERRGRDARMNRFVVSDPSRCIGCSACRVTCTESHRRRALRPASRISLVKTRTVSAAVTCHQCEGAPCMTVCPEGAIVQERDRLHVDESRCTGCLLCALVCPFGAVYPSAPSTAHVKAAPYSRASSARSAGLLRQKETGAYTSVVMCDLCAKSPNGPRCVEACPTKALALVDEGMLEALGRTRRIEAIEMTDIAMRGALGADLAVRVDALFDREGDA